MKAKNIKYQRQYIEELIGIDLAPLGNTSVQCISCCHLAIVGEFFSSRKFVDSILRSSCIKDWEEGS